MTNICNIPNIRTINQQLDCSSFSNAKDLVAWMGAMQAQDYTMAKWAIGIRLNSNITDKEIEEAFNRGDILRTHVMRPTWHFVPNEDIRWMIKLTGQRMKNSISLYFNKEGITAKLHLKINSLIEKTLSGNNHSTKQEIESILNKEGIPTNNHLLNGYLMFAEVDNLICSGAVKAKKQTYALLDERVPSTKDIQKEEALIKLATRYFKSHSPATLNDFVWWSGLSITESKQAINLIKSELVTEKVNEVDFFIHESCKNDVIESPKLHFLPAFDEYLISYKDRTSVLNLEHHPKAFNNFGTFYPVILCNGQIIGNWKKVTKGKQTLFETVFFDKKIKPNQKQIKEAEGRYRSFLS